MENLQNGLVITSASGFPQSWETLFTEAMKLIAEIALHGRNDPFWTFGGGTVLMLRYGHRNSKDIDIFFLDPQSLGFVTPRLSDVAASITTEYVEAADYVKLYLPEGEIDFVAAPNLTVPAFDIGSILGEQVRVETSVEIIAKKMWHRGHRITGRDIFDFALVAEREPSALIPASEFMIRHAQMIFQHLDERYIELERQFNGVEALNFHPTFEQARITLKSTLQTMLATPGKVDKPPDDR